jgi:hypothetical protein
VIGSRSGLTAIADDQDRVRLNHAEGGDDPRHDHEYEEARDWAGVHPGPSHHIGPDQARSGSTGLDRSDLVESGEDDVVWGHIIADEQIEHGVGGIRPEPPR